MTITPIISIAKLALLLVLLSHAILPVRNGNDLGWRWEIARSIVAVTHDVEEASILMAIARFESNYAPRVVTCARKGPGGECGAFQVAPRNGKEAERLCADRIYSAQRALEEVRKSRELCAHLPARWSLSYYASGSCNRGRKHSAHRWAAAHKEVPSAAGD